MSGSSPAGRPVRPRPAATQTDRLSYCLPQQPPAQHRGPAAGAASPPRAQRQLRRPDRGDVADRCIAGHRGRRHADVKLRWTISPLLSQTAAVTQTAGSTSPITSCGLATPTALLSVGVPSDSIFFLPLTEIGRVVLGAVSEAMVVPAVTSAYRRPHCGDWRTTRRRRHPRPLRGVPEDTGSLIGRWSFAERIPPPVRWAPPFHVICVLMQDAGWPADHRGLSGATTVVAGADPATGEPPAWPAGRKPPRREA